VSDHILNQKNHEGSAVHLVNSYTLVLANNSKLLRGILQNDILVCDGKPLFWFLRFKNEEIQNIRGADLMRNVLRESPNNIKHFFLGSTETVIESLINNVQVINPNINIVGTYSPNFSIEFNSEIPKWIQLIAESHANIVWVGLGTPKQDFVVHELAKYFPACFLAVGAAFDFIAGNAIEAPIIFRKLGIEWFFRLISEPRRLAKRYLIGNVLFLKLLLVEQFFPNRSRF
jgi:N-acetylglucosaminyldiphosphoundecaprenol N-acetyl-beta-D-mannosaminyltransferase